MRRLADWYGRGGVEHAWAVVLALVDGEEGDKPLQRDLQVLPTVRTFIDNKVLVRVTIRDIL
jgi:hypothetical protein